MVDRRRHQRQPVKLTGRYMLPGGAEYECETVDISPGGMRLRAPAVPYIGQRVIAYVEEIGRVEGIATRVLRDGFAMRLHATSARRERYAATITWAAFEGLEDERDSGRIVPRERHAVATLASGRRVPVSIVNVSTGGAAIECRERLPLDSTILIGPRAAVVIRIENGAYAVAFKERISAGDLDANIVFL